MDFTKLGGLIPAVVQDAATGDVLMVGFMNDEAYARTVETGYATFFSRTRNTLWTKGETSGNRLRVHQVLSSSGTLGARVVEISLARGLRPMRAKGKSMMSGSQKRLNRNGSMALNWVTIF